MLGIFLALNCCAHAAPKKAPSNDKAQNEQKKPEFTDADLQRIDRDSNIWKAINAVRDTVEKMLKEFVKSKESADNLSSKIINEATDELVELNRKDPKATEEECAKIAKEHIAQAEDFFNKDKQLVNPQFINEPPNNVQKFNAAPNQNLSGLYIFSKELLNADKVISCVLENKSVEDFRKGLMKNIDSIELKGIRLEKEDAFDKNAPGKHLGKSDEQHCIHISKAGLVTRKIVHADDENINKQKPLENDVANAQNQLKDLNKQINLKQKEFTDLDFLLSTQRRLMSINDGRLAKAEAEKDAELEKQKALSEQNAKNNLHSALNNIISNNNQGNEKKKGTLYEVYATTLPNISTDKAEEIKYALLESLLKNNDLGKYAIISNAKASNADTFIVDNTYDYHKCCYELTYKPIKTAEFLLEMGRHEDNKYRFKTVFSQEAPCEEQRYQVKDLSTPAERARYRKAPWNME